MTPISEGGNIIGTHARYVLIKAFFETRIEHLTIADRVRVECLGKMPDGSSCNRIVLIAVQGLCQPGYRLIRDLKPLLKYDNCGERGHVDLTIVWADK